MPTNHLRLATALGFTAAVLTTACEGADENYESGQEALSTATSLPSFSTTQHAANALGVFKYKVTTLSGENVKADLQGPSGNKVGSISFNQFATPDDPRFAAGSPVQLASVTWSGGTQRQDQALTRFEPNAQYIEGFFNAQRYAFYTPTDCGDDCDESGDLSRPDLDRAKANAILRGDLTARLIKANRLPSINAAVAQNVDEFSSVVIADNSLSPGVCRRFLSQCLTFCGPRPLKARLICKAGCYASYPVCRKIPGDFEGEAIGFTTDVGGVFGF